MKLRWGSPMKGRSKRRRRAARGDREVVADYPCRRCDVCSGLSHHWMEGFDEDEDGELVHPDDPRWQCKHCDFSMPYGYLDMDTEEPEDMYQARKAAGLVREAAPC